MRKLAFILALICSSYAYAQQPASAPTSEPPQKATPAGEQSKAAGALESAQKLVNSEPNTLMSDEKIPSGARVYVAPMVNGFDNYIVAGLQQKKVPVRVVADRSKAEYEITGVAETDKAGWAKMLFLGSTQTAETASMKMINLKTGTVVFAYSVNKWNSARGKQSAGEACAKHVKEKILD